MDRFRGPDIEIIITYCAQCDCELYKGDSVYVVDGEYFCSHDCLIEYIDPQIKILGDERI